MTNWRKRTVQPTEILDAADTIQAVSSSFETDLIADWTISECYLTWAKDALSQNNDFGRDAAVCYAKRAVCRQIDAFMVCNHLWHLDAKLNYPEKIEVLTDVGLYVPSVVHELVIDPRNQLEHSYRLPTEAEAMKAVQLCEMFLKATCEETKHNAILSVGWSIQLFRQETCSIPGREYNRINFTISPLSSPMLLIDVFDARLQHNVMILLPKDGEVMTCPLKEFDRRAATKLAIILRQTGEFQKSCKRGYQKLNREYLQKFKEDIRL